MQPDEHLTKAKADIPPGLKMRYTLRGHNKSINRIAWSPEGQRLASPSEDGDIIIWDMKTGKAIATLQHPGGVASLAWSPQGKTLISGGYSGISLWDVRTKKRLKILSDFAHVFSLAWSPDGQFIASGEFMKGAIRLWTPTCEPYLTFDGSHEELTHLAWSPDGQMLAGCYRSDSSIRLWKTHSEKLHAVLKGDSGFNNYVAWSPDGRRLASCGGGTTIRMWDVETKQILNILEGHAGNINAVHFSPDGRLLASKSSDGTVRIWRCDSWETVAVFGETKSIFWIPAIAFNPTNPLLLATLGEMDTVIRVWELDHDLLLGAAAPSRTVKYTSAKVMLVGESNVGKSCLAMRLAENRYPKDHEQSTTHGMRFWSMQPEQLSGRAAPSSNERRDIVLWDMGGQSEYQLVHQLFLRDTTLALFLFDPTRGRAAFEEMEAWNIRFENQLQGRKCVKLLVGSKIDKPNNLVNRKSLEALIARCGFKGYYETSALTGRGIAELREAMAGALDWGSLAKIIRPELFQRIRDEIEDQRKIGQVILYLNDIKRHLRKWFSKAVEHQPVEAVAEQLAAQGLVAITRLSSGEGVLVLQVGEIERYAGSLIMAARGNLRDVPTLEVQSLQSPDLSLPGIAEKDRLQRHQELVVLECVVQLLIEHGICFQQEGLLIFPSLFSAVEQVEGEASQSVSLSYDFSGAIDNIYASLVAWLVIGQQFGRVRLRQNQAEFEAPGRGVCGLRKVERGRGFAHLDIFFDDEVSRQLRGQFVNFVERHLRQHGVDIIEHLEVTCTCGYQFTEDSINKRIAKGEEDIGCPECDCRIKITEGVKRLRERDPDLAHRTWALRTEIEKRRKQIVANVPQVFANLDERQDDTEPIRLLHLSDLHLSGGVDTEQILQPLIDDIRDESGGLGFKQVDFLIISGDLTNRAAPEEFEVARQFVSALIREFDLTAERCIVVPGNHDLSWEEEVYHWKPGRSVNVAGLLEEHYYPQGDGYLVRDERSYPNRFRNFSQYFYHPLVQKEYPLAFEEQCISYLFPQTGLQFIALNSSWHIDEWFRNRAGINLGALARGLVKAREEIERAVDSKVLDVDAPILRIGVWHHPVTGNDKIRDDAFMERLRRSAVRLCLHGHVHENRAEVVGYPHPQKIHVIGAGSFGAEASQRPESTPRLYNVLEIARDHSSVKVHTRSMLKQGGAWEGWAVWPTQDPTRKSSYYIIGESG
ncbi:MAG: metallophosphoesterase [Acidobacteria bacterium]|nr:metallophosphoesterase [Acidobacteriota bacterium]